MTISAKVIEDSISAGCPRLITMELKYPRFIHSEFMTHRVFSRNASSSRAIPIEKMIQSVLDDAAMPVEWGSNKPGMQAGSQINCREEAADRWLLARDEAVHHARRLHGLGLHKQIVNRVLEPFAHITVVVTSTEWDNFFALRRHDDADPTIRALADAMWIAQISSTPRKLTLGDAHLPYLNDSERNHMYCQRLSAARCARVSYLTHDGTVPSVEEDLALYHRLVGSAPMHASPLEHQATPDGQRDNKHHWGNLRGWVQYRKLVGA